MKQLLKDYLDIFQSYPKNQYFSKKERKERYLLLEKYAKIQYDQLPTINEFQDFFEKYQDQIDIHPQFLEKFTPVFQEDIASGQNFALKFLLGDSEENNYFSKFFDWAYSAFGDRYDLLNTLLEREPDYLPALTQKFQLLLNAASFSIHELPLGVLAGMDGADAEDIPAMLVNLDDLLAIAEKIQLKDHELEGFVAECRQYYLAWQDYLLTENRLQLSFGDFLKQRGISY